MHQEMNDVASAETICGVGDANTFGTGGAKTSGSMGFEMSNAVGAKTSDNMGFKTSSDGVAETSEAHVFEMSFADGSKSVDFADDKSFTREKNVDVMIKTCVPRDSSDNDLVVSDVSFSKELSVGHRGRIILP